MKTLWCGSHRHSLAAVLAGLISAFFLSSPAQAAVLTYDTTTNLGWFATGAWDSGTATWTSGDSAVINTASTLTVNMTSSTNVNNLTLGGNGSLSLTGITSNRVLQMSGGNLSVTNLGAGVIFGARAVIQGNYTFDTNGWLRINSTLSQAYVGTATVQTGRIHYTYGANQTGSGSNFIINGGEVLIERSGANMGTLTLNSGNFTLGRTGNTTNHTFTVGVSRLEGNGSTAKIQNALNGNGTQTFLVNQSDNTTYAGRILATTGNVTEVNRLIFQKDGAGDLSLTGQLDLRLTTTVSGGRLYINNTSANATFQDEVGTTAISVTGGSLGGTGTIKITGTGDNISLGANGGLTAGLAGVAGRTTIEFNSGNLDLSLATASANTSWLHFDLGGNGTAGTTYDQISLTGGNLNIGTGLNFSDFSFSALSGFGAGNYVLFATPGMISGSLGTATGTIGGLNAELSISGNNLVVDVVPEPSTWALLAFSLTTVMVLRRRRS